MKITDLEINLGRRLAEPPPLDSMFQGIAKGLSEAIEKSFIVSNRRLQETLKRLTEVPRISIPSISSTIFRE